MCSVIIMICLYKVYAFYLHILNYLAQLILHVLEKSSMHDKPVPETYLRFQKKI